MASKYPQKAHKQIMELENIIICEKNERNKNIHIDNLSPNKHVLSIFLQCAFFNSDTINVIYNMNPSKPKS